MQGILQLASMLWLLTHPTSSGGAQPDTSPHTPPPPSTVNTTQQSPPTETTHNSSNFPKTVSGADTNSRQLGAFGSEKSLVRQDVVGKKSLSSTPPSVNITTVCPTTPHFQGVMSEPRIDRDPPYPWHEDTENMCVYRVQDITLEECQLQLKVPEGKIIKLRVCKCMFSNITLHQYDTGRRFYPDLLGQECRLTVKKNIFTLTNHVVLNIRKLPKIRFFLVDFNISVANKSEAPRFKVIYLSSFLGYVYSPNHSTRARTVFDCFTVRLPREHVAMFSRSPFYNTEPACLSWHVGECGQSQDNPRNLEHFPVLFLDGLNSKRGNHDVAYSQHEDNNLLVSLVYTNIQYVIPDHVFTLSFSFHKNSSRPQQLGSTWNCSSAVWPDLLRHFPVCDLIGQCVEFEDETNCPYTSKVYGPGYIEAGDSQVFLTELHDLDSQTQAVVEQACRARGAQPVSLDSSQKWTSLVTALSNAAKYPYAKFVIALHPTELTLENTQDTYRKNMYINTWQWGSGTIAYFFHPSFSQLLQPGPVIRIPFPRNQQPVSTDITRSPKKHRQKFLAKYQLCEIPHHSKHASVIPLAAALNLTASQTAHSLLTCALGHVTHVMLACDPSSLCGGSWAAGRGLSYTRMCRDSLSQESPYFACLKTEERVPYSAVCDWRRDCADSSDEAFCHFPPCAQGTFTCGRGQCIPYSQKCDRRDDCVTFADERFCQNTDISIHFNVTPSPALVSFDRPGSFSVVPVTGEGTRPCPATHYQCPGHGYCLPVHTRCNAMRDCSGREDEADCDWYVCEGLYRCRGLDTSICLHTSHLCDGVAQCPHQDDELACGRLQSCPDHCTCYGTHLYRSEPVLHPRYLEGRGSGVTAEEIANHSLLVHLGVGACGWRNISDIRLVNLHVFDLSDNLLQTINFINLAYLKNLKELVLSGNPLSTSFSRSSSRYKISKLLLLNLSHVPDQSSNLHMFSSMMPRLQILDLSKSGLTSLKGSKLFRYLSNLNLQGCPISEFTPDFMKGMDNLKFVSGDNFKLCCSAVLPETFTGRCVAPVDEISSCKNLLMSGFYAFILAVFALLALLGNLGSLVYRLTVFPKGKSKVGFLVFVIHLSLSDFLMGIYLSIIGVTDGLYAGNYLWKEQAWKRSAVCHLAGVLSLLSCEASSFFICLITLDRFLVIRFPFSQVRFGTTSAQIACVVVWGLGLILASIPLLPVTSHWAFYSQTGICVPLPVTRADFPGHHYSFSVMIVLNLVIFMCIAVGQAFIYWSVKVNTMAKEEGKSKEDSLAKGKARSKEFTIARRLLVIAASDFLCWFPIGVCGLLAKLDIPVPGEVNAAMATLVLPVNAALNPFLYTYTVLQQRRQKERESSLQKMIAAQVKHELVATHR